MIEVTYIIPAYGKSEIVERSVGSIALQWLAKDNINIIIVNDCSPNTDCDYQDLIDKYKHLVKSIKCIRTKENSGQGTARQTGIDACNTEWFLLCDEDDMYSAIAYYTFSDALEGSMYEIDEKGNYIKDKYKEGYVPIAVVSAALEQVSHGNMATIQNDNDLWVNSKVYNKKFLTEHDIIFHPMSSRHSEDYQFTQDFFFCLNYDDNWTGILIDDSRQLYYWLDNNESQSRSDKFYGEMLSGYTARSSLLGLNFILDWKNHGLNKWTDDMQEHFNNKLINNVAYNWFTFFHFIKCVVVDEYMPALEDDWYILRDACNDLRKMLKKYWDNFTYVQRMEQIYMCKNMSDCRGDTEPWVSLDEFCQNGCPELEWSFDDLLNSKNKYIFNDKNILISKG